MKPLTLIFLALNWRSAFAHGPVASQASTAVAKATVLFLNEEASVRDGFQSLNCKLVGDERFEVDFLLKNGMKLSYACGLDESTKPVKWGCKKK